MPQTDFFLDVADEERIVNFIFGLGGWIVPGFNDDDTPARICDWETYTRCKYGKLCFILFDAYSECPLELFRVQDGHYKGKYAVRQRVGGPTIDLFSPGPYERDGTRWLPDGMIGYHNTYMNTVTQEMESVPTSLIDMYRTIVNEIKRDGYLVKGQSRKYWLANQAYLSVKAGSRLHVPGLPAVE
jgi:hypothetical protein